MTKDDDDADVNARTTKIQQKKTILPGIGWLKSLFHGNGETPRNSTARNSSSTCATATPFRSRDVSTQMRQVFRVIDSNGDGKISPEELGKVLRRLGHNKLSAFKEAKGMISAADRDGDGLIDIDEFMQVVTAAGDGTGVDNDDEDLAAAFQVFDANKDGYISAWELRRVLRGLRQIDGCCSLRRCARMIRAVDRNGDGRVDFQEFRMLMVADRRPSTGAS